MSRSRLVTAGLGAVTLWALSAWALAAQPLDFDVAPSDEPAGAAYTWHEALRTCEDKGMALPTLEDMARIFCHADLEQKRIVDRYPQVDRGCEDSGVSASLPNFKEKGRYWTASRYNDGVVRYIDLLDGNLGYYGKEERLNVRCIIPEARAPRSAPTPRPYPYDINDVDEGSFDAIIDTLVGIYAAEFAAKGMRLSVRKDWAEQEQNARSWLIEENDRQARRIREVREIELIGGLARHPMLNRDAYALVICHEIGHHLGGAPRALGYSSEGQADYFATAKCMKRYLATVDYRQPYGEFLPEASATRCAASFAAPEQRRICRRSILAGLTLARWFGHSRGVEPPRLERPAPERRHTTLVHGYPRPQCRLDTLVAGALCPEDALQPFADGDARVAACTRAAGYEHAARPRCWFAPGPPPLRADAD